MPMVFKTLFIAITCLSGIYAQSSCAGTTESCTLAHDSNTLLQKKVQVSLSQVDDLKSVIADIYVMATTMDADTCGDLAANDARCNPRFVSIRTGACDPRYLCRCYCAKVGDTCTDRSRDSSYAVYKKMEAPVAEVDFSVDSQSNTNYELRDGAQILTAPGGFKALRIDKDGPYALIQGVNIGPNAMPACTLMIGLYVESFNNTRGWVLSHEDGGYDRTILVNDDRFGGGLASAVGKTWFPWSDAASKGKVPAKQWVHLTAVFQSIPAVFNLGDVFDSYSYVYLNGIRSDNKVIATNNKGRNDLYIGRPKGWSNHWVDSWIKEVKVFDQALTDGSIADYAKIFLSEASGMSGDAQGLASRSATDIWYSGCQRVEDLSKVLANVDGQVYDMTISACFAKCKKKRGMKYFALANGAQCLCSVTPPGQEIDEGSCNRKCSGKSNEICGGDSINIASVYTMVNCAPLPSSELDAEYKDALADLYEVWEGESCGKSDDNLCEIKGSAKMAADLKECKLACWEEQGSDKCNGFTYDKATSECTFYQDVLDGTVTKGPQLACFFKKLGYPLNLRG